jgi:phage terminase large subunit GpA-like protein
MTPTPNIDMDVWAQQRFHLPKQSYIPGLINLSLTPYNPQIMRDLSPSSPIRKVVYICGTQVAKSTIILIAFAYRVDCKIYGDMLYYFPDDGMAAKWSKTKLEDVIKANDFLRNEFESRKRSDDNVTLKKTLIGALIIKGGQSGGKYRMDTGLFIVADDYADFPLNIGATTSGKLSERKMGEGAADKLLEDRGSGTGESAKLFINSSPKSEKECPAWRSYEQTNKHHFFITCPKCGTEQAWEFENVKFNRKAKYELDGEPWIECQNSKCDHKVYQDDKYKIMQTGVWKPTAETRDPETNGYRLPSVYSLLGYPLKKMAQDWLDACKTYDETGDESEKIRHRNSKQARPWQRKVGKKVNHSLLFHFRENMEPLPENCVILSCGFDIQRNPGRIEGQVNGFGPNHERYVIDHQVFGGDPTIKPGLDGSPWNDVAKFLLEKRYLNSFEKQQPIYCAAFDLGWGKGDGNLVDLDNIRKEEAWIKYFIQNFEPLHFQQIFGVFGKEMTKGAINFVSHSATQDVDGFESWGIYTNIERVSLRNLLKTHIERKQAKMESNFHISDKPVFTEQLLQQFVIRQPDEKGIMKKPHDHARDEGESCCIYSLAAFILAFREFEQGPDWDDFKAWNAKPIVEQKSAGISVLGSVF